ncbi:MAG: efflux RND transporter periplasmic adaptor subunit [Akkermansiaceae bacterium]|nr:efflux RND transporter periplasmic adaptor subunit [Akkermansiaceae bacterium]
MASPSGLRNGLVWLGIMAVLAVSSWFGWKALRDAGPAGGDGRGGGRPPSVVIVRPAVQKEVAEVVKVTGTLRAVRRAEVAALESAAVVAIGADEGDLVEEGGMLARLDGRRIDAQLAEAEADLTAAEADLGQREAELERARTDEAMMRALWNERAVAEREFLDSVRGLKVANARLDAGQKAMEAAAKRRDLLELRRGDLEVRAPFRGRVVARHAELGEWLREGDPVVTLVSTMEVEAWLQLPERYATSLRETGPEAIELRVPGIESPLRADRLQVIPDVEGRSRLFVMVAHIPDPENRLTPGSSVEAAVPLGKPEPRIVVSSDAILQGYSGAHVFVPEPAGDGPPIARRVPVEVLFERGGESILKSGALEAGALVIVEGNERLFPNTPLDPHSWEETRAGDGAPGAPRRP